MLMQTFHKVVHDVRVSQLGLLLVSLLFGLLIGPTCFCGYSIAYYYFWLSFRLLRLLLNLGRLFFLWQGLRFFSLNRFFIIHLLVLVLLFLGIFLLFRIVFRLSLLIMYMRRLCSLLLFYEWILLLFRVIKVNFILILNTLRRH